MDDMPRKARIDAPGALHHIIVRGIDRRKIFFDDFDRAYFLNRLGLMLSESKTPCFAWTTFRGRSIFNLSGLIPRSLLRNLFSW